MISLMFALGFLSGRCPASSSTLDRLLLRAPMEISEDWIYQPHEIGFKSPYVLNQELAAYVYCA